MHINSVLMILRQMGVGPQEGFGISDATATWSEFCQNRADIEAVKSYTALKVKMLFDPPQSSSTMEATKNLISELEWRLYACLLYTSSESSVRSKYAGTADKKAQRAENIADTLKKEVDKKGMIDI